LKKPSKSLTRLKRLRKIIGLCDILPSIGRLSLFQ